MEADLITDEHKGKILIGGSIITSDALSKAVKVGVTGIVVGGIRHPDLINFVGYEIGVAITGEEDLGITLIITEGFGKMNMSERVFDLFKTFDGFEASMNGATQIRAGVMRPELVIPHQEKKDISDDGLIGGMTLGTPVRII
ncbi:unnamed protein product, partial [marine sediment metagenome]